MNDLELIKKIRHLRVNKKKRKVRAEEMAIANLGKKINSTKETINENIKSYSNDRNNTIKKMLSESFNVNEFFSLKKKEKLFDKNLSLLKSSEEKLEIEIADRKQKQKRQLEQLAQLEKSEIKIEEFINMEAEK